MKPVRATLIFVGQLLKIRLAGLGLAIVVGFLILAAGAELIAPYDPYYQDYQSVLQGPSLAHLMGTDDMGRDVLSRIIHGSRISLQVGLVSVGLAMVGGIILGLASGYCSGWLDELLMRLVDAVWSFPALLLALAITAALGQSIGNAMIAIGVVYMPAFARLVRAQTLSIRERDFVLAARLLGATPSRLMVKHIWPNVTAPVIVQASLYVSFAIITEASLSFLGVGVSLPTPAWGSMLRVGYRYLETALWLPFFPGLAIFLTVLGLNLLGDGLRIVWDPRLRAKGKG
ncbi:MAG: ABC transporter permease [Dehalococcoidales bacterium]|nr:ABC transporter permease [Dehalococcoidales bacterium]